MSDQDRKLQALQRFRRDARPSGGVLDVYSKLYSSCKRSWRLSERSAVIAPSQCQQAHLCEHDRAPASAPWPGRSGADPSPAPSSLLFADLAVNPKTDDRERGQIKQRLLQGLVSKYMLGP